MRPNILRELLSSRYINKCHDNIQYILRKSHFSSSHSQWISHVSNSKILGTKLFSCGKFNVSSLELYKNKNRELVDIDGTGYRDISINKHHGGIVTGKGDVYMFGTSEYGELGLNEIKETKQPTKIPSLSNIIQISCGINHTACIDIEGNVYTWGWGGNGKWIFTQYGGLGHGNTETINSPKMIKQKILSNIKHISCGGWHTLCVNDKNEIFSFGNGKYNRLGTGSNKDLKKPKKLLFFQNIPIYKVFASNDYSFAMTKDGMVYGWGSNQMGQMARPNISGTRGISCNTIPTAVNIPDMSNIIDIALSVLNVLCVDNNGICYYWGYQTYEEYSNPYLINNDMLFKHISRDKIINVAISDTKMYFLTDKGELFESSHINETLQPINKLKDEFITKVVVNAYDDCCFVISR